MIEFRIEKLAPRRVENRQKVRSKGPITQTVEIAYCLYLCGGTTKPIVLEVIAEQAWETYPQLFITEVSGKNIPDLAAIQSALTEGALDLEGLVLGNRTDGWRLSERGVKISADVDRRRRLLSPT